MKILNIEQVKPATRQVQINGRAYAVTQLNCGVFMALQEIQQTPASNTLEQMKGYLKIIEMMVPSLDEKVLLGLEIEQLVQLVEFVTSAVEEETQDAVADEQGKA